MARLRLHSVLALAVVLGLSVGVDAAAAVWPVDAGDARRTGQATVDTSPTNGKETWSDTEARGGKGVLAGPEGSIVWAGASVRVYDKDGKPVLSVGRLKDGSAFKTTGVPALGPDGTLYVPAQFDLGQHGVAALAADGDLRWRANVGACSGAPVVSSDGTVFVADCGKGVVALDPATGAVRWTFEASFSSRVALGPDGTLYTTHGLLTDTGSAGTKLTALDPATGTAKWSHLVEPAGPQKLPVALSAPAVGPDGTVYVAQSPPGTNEFKPLRAILAFGPDGSPKWTGTVATQPSRVLVRADGAIVAIGVAGGWVLDAATGEVCSEMSLGGGDRWILGADGTLLRVQGAKVIAHAADGKELWTFTAPRPVTSNLAVRSTGEILVAHEGGLAAIGGDGTAARPPPPAKCGTSAATAEGGGEKGVPALAAPGLLALLASVALAARRSVRR